MKKTLLAVLGMLCSATMVAGFASCDLLGMGGGDSSVGGTSTITYTLDSKSFNKTVKYGSSFNYSGLTIKSSDGDTVQVNASMVNSSSVNTSSVGSHTLQISYEGESFSVTYTVKYAVEFIADGASLGVQYVESASEIEMPVGYENSASDDWEPAVPAVTETMTDNMTFTLKESTSTPSGDITAQIGESGAYAMYVTPSNATGETLSISVTPANLNASYEVTSSNENVSVSYNSGIKSLIVEAHKPGVSTVTVKVTNKDNPDEYAEVKKTIVVKPTSLTIDRTSEKPYGIEGIYTFGRFEGDGTTVSQLPLSLNYDASSVGAGFAEHIVWESDNALASIDENGVITLKEGTGAEMVKFTANFKVGEETYVSSDAYEMRCVFDGVNVDSYAELQATTIAEKPVVLQGNIKDDFSSTYYTEMATTYDDTYYKNIEREATIKVLLQFRNDLYGNGYQINAHNATYKLDGTGAPVSAIFNGPLNFVAMSESEGGGMLSVKAQDNVCFAVFEGVTINNVELKGCDLSETNGTVDLTDLNYIGTTVEVFGDDVTIEYSRITNGRTVLRIFGDEKDSEKEINVDIKNCVLSGAREFILRMGSNCFKDGTDENVSPYLSNDQLDLINVKANYQTMADKENYDDQYIKTFVTVQNSVFKDAGIFAVGIDSHFSGEALHKGHSILGSSSQYWRNLAKTSYGAKLTFKETVRMYNWKLLGEIDSSTLIENSMPEGSDLREQLQFNVKDMVKNVSGKDGFETIITNWNENDYVHAGIAFFGGGKNYGVFENLGTSERLVGFEVTLEDVGKGFLMQAAGTESFYFMICDQTSTTFTPQHQEQLLADGDEAYKCIYTK